MRVSEFPSDDQGRSSVADDHSELPIILSSYIQANLMPGERLIAITRVHPMVLVVPGVLSVLGLILGLIGLAAGNGAIVFLAVPGIFAAVTGGFVVLAMFIERLTTEFSCTDRRILIKSGLLTTQLREMPLGKVEALFME